MNTISFLFRGVEGFPQYSRYHYPIDSALENYAKIDNFKGKITKTLLNDNLKTIHFDNAYKFTTISDKIRNECSEIWSVIKTGTSLTSCVTFIGGLTTLALAVALGIIIPGLYLVAIALGVVALAILGFSLFASHRFSTAEQQLKLWEDPTNSQIKACEKEHEEQVKKLRNVKIDIIIELVKQSLEQGGVKKETASSILEPYYSQFPELKASF